MDSMTKILLGPLQQLQHLSSLLFLSLSPTQPKQPQPPSVQSFLQADAELAAAVKLAHKHQARQRKIELLKNEILQLDESWKAICQELENGRKELEDMIEEGEERIRATEAAKQASIPYPELLAYAQSLSTFTSAPPNMPDPPGQHPLPLFFPPFPNEEKMRRGKLNAEAPLGLLGEIHPVGRPPTASPPPVDEPHTAGPHPYRIDHRPQQRIFDLDLDLNPDL